MVCPTSEALPAGTSAQRFHDRLEQPDVSAGPPNHQVAD